MNPSYAGQGFSSIAAHSAVLPVLEQARARLLLVAVVFMLGAFIIVGRLFDVMIFTPEVDKSGRLISPPPISTRADITDRNGELLATSLQMASLSADPALVLDVSETLRKLKSVFPDLVTNELNKNLHEKTRFVLVRRNLTPKQQDAVNRLGLPGIGFVNEERRMYPKGRLTAHVIGYNSVDNRGIAGIEHSFDDFLRRKDKNLVLSLDIRLQNILRDALWDGIRNFNAIGGAGLVMDVHSGEVLAMVSLPDFNPYEPGKADEKTLFNRVTLGAYEMGSIFKIFTLSQALETGAVSLSSSFDCTHPLKIGKFTINDFHPQKRWLNVPEIFIHSSNIGAVHIIQKIGGPAQKEFLSRLGLTTPSPIELPEVGKPLLPPEWKDLSMMTISFGHGMAVTAMQLASAAASIINGGHLVTPTLLKKQTSEVRQGPAIISPQTSDAMRAMMRAVVTKGTGKTAEVKGYFVGGKTGTAEKQQGKGYSKSALLSSFIGIFPANDPRYLVLVMIDEPHGTKESYGFATGGWVAAPMVKKVIADGAPLLGVAPAARGDMKTIEERLRLPVKISSE